MLTHEQRKSMLFDTNTIANFIGFESSMQLMKYSRLVVTPKLGVVGYLVDLANSSYPHNWYRYAFWDSYLEEHLQFFKDMMEVVQWLTGKYSDFKLVKQW